MQSHSIPTIDFEDADDIRLISKLLDKSIERRMFSLPSYHEIHAEPILGEIDIPGEINLWRIFRTLRRLLSGIDDRHLDAIGRSSRRLLLYDYTGELAQGLKRLKVPWQTRFLLLEFRLAVMIHGRSYATTILSAAAVLDNIEKFINLSA